MVQIEAASTPECQEGLTSQGGQHREEHSVVHHVQVEHYYGQFKMVWVGLHASDRSLKYHWVLQWCPESRWTLKGKIQGSPPCSRRTLWRTPWTMYQKPNHEPHHKQNHEQIHEQNHEQNHDSWTISQTITINQGLTLSTIRPSFNFFWRLPLVMSRLFITARGWCVTDCGNISISG